MSGFNLQEYIIRQIDWSLRTFGDGNRTMGLVKHIERELSEIQQNPTDVIEWVDVIILALDGAWRAGWTPSQIIEALEAKQTVNFLRKWPKSQPLNEPTEHIRDSQG